MIGTIVFLLCFTLKKYELDIGMALGLFAIFGIIRYRTDTVEIKEMTYLFVVIGVSVINSLANQKMSYAEIIGGNLLIVFALYFIEKNGWLPIWQSNESSMRSLKTSSQSTRICLKLIWKKELDWSIEEIHIGNIDFLKDSVVITIKYHQNQETT